MPNFLPPNPAGDGQTGLESRIRSQNFLTINTGLFAERATDDFDRAFVGQRNQTAGNRSHSIIDIARGDRDCHRLRGLKEPQFHLKACVGKIVPLCRDKAGGVRRESQRADDNLFVLCNGGRRKPRSRRRADQTQCLPSVQVDHSVLPNDRGYRFRPPNRCLFRLLAPPAPWPRRGRRSRRATCRGAPCGRQSRCVPRAAAPAETGGIGRRTALPY